MIVFATAGWTVLLAATVALVAVVGFGAARSGTVRVAHIAWLAVAVGCLVAAGRTIASVALQRESELGDAVLQVVVPAAGFAAGAFALLFVAARRAPRGVGVLAAATALLAAADVVQFRLGVGGILPVLALGTALLVLAAPARWTTGTVLTRGAGVLALVGVLLLVAPFVPGLGVEINGARAWIVTPLGPVMPGELGRLLLFLGTAGLLARHGSRIELVDARRFGFASVAVRPLAVSLGGVALGLVLLAVQKDLGPALIVAVGVGVLTTVLTGRVRFVAIAVGAVVAGAVGGWLVIPRLQERVSMWLAPLGPEPAGLSQFGNARAALAWSGWQGTGIGASIQHTQPGIVTHSDSDYALVALAAETGLLGTIAVLALMALLVVLLWMGAARALSKGGLDSSGPYAVAVASMIGTHVVVNLAGLFGLIPLTGITTLFVSAGGMSLIATTIALALAARWADDAAPVTIPDLAVAGSRLPFAARRQRRGLVAGAATVLLLVPAGAAAANTMTFDASRVNGSGMSPQQHVADATDLGDIVSADGVVLATTEARGILDRARRVYPAGDLVSEVVGTTTPFGSATGLEAAWWPLLRCGVSPAEPVPADRSGCRSADLAITIDTAWQRAAVAALDGVDGAVVVMRASTGEILAAASSARVDPAGHSDRDVATALAAASVPTAPGTWAAAVPPGSVFKLAVFLAAQEKWGAALPTLDTTQCPAVDDLAMALAVSCNSVFQSLARDLGVAAVMDAAARLGFTASDVSGLPLPVAAVDEATANPQLVAIGQQDVRITLVGAAAAGATIASGELHVPTLTTASEARGALGEQERAALADAMRLTVTDGTLHGLAGLPGAWAGKTGTSENGDGSTNALAVAFSTSAEPLDTANIVISALVLPSPQLWEPAGGRDAGAVVDRVVSSRLIAGGAS